MSDDANALQEPFVRILDTGDCHILTVHGDIDLAVAPSLRQGLTRACLDRSGTLILDMRDVTFMDSTALSILIETQASLQAAGRGLRLVCGDGVVTRLLSLAGLEEMFPCYGTPEEAVAATQKGSDVRSGG